MQTDAITTRLELGLIAAREAGRLTLEYFRRDDLQVELKSDDTPVTIADRGAEQLLRKRIAAAFPGDGLLGEEFPEQAGDSGFRWIFDPIDGTKSFIHGVPLYGCLVGLEFEGQPVMGIVHLPALDESVYAATGQGAWHVVGDQQAKPARVSRQANLNQSLFCTSEVKSFGDRGAIGVFEELQSSVRLARTWGDCFGYVLVATGRAEIMVDPIMNVWDAAAMLPIIQEAGGAFTDWQGRPTINSGDAIATNGLVHDEVLAITRLSRRLGTK